MSWFCFFVFRFCFLQFCLFFFLVFTTRLMFCFSSHSRGKKIEIHWALRMTMTPSSFVFTLNTHIHKRTIQFNHFVYNAISGPSANAISFDLLSFLCFLFIFLLLCQSFTFFFLLHCAYGEEEKCFRVTIWFIQLLNHCFGNK